MYPHSGRRIFSRLSPQSIVWGSSVVFLSGLGTFLSVRFGDEVMDVVSRRERAFFNRHSYKYKLIVIAVVFLMIMICYYELIHSLGIEDVIKEGR